MSTGAEQTPQQVLRRIGLLESDAIHLCDTALWLAKWAEPSLNLEPYRRHLETLVDDVLAYVSRDRDDDALVLEAAQQILARRYGYGEKPDLVESFSLAKTIDQRRGDCLILAMMYRHVLLALDRSVEIMDFAPRPLVAVYTRTSRMLLDPSNGSLLLTARDLRRLVNEHHDEDGTLAPDHLTALNPRQILLRLLHDIKTLHLRHAAPEAALLTIEGALLIAPDDTRLWRELGLLHMRLDHIVDAAAALERFLQLPGSGPHRYTASQLLQQLRQRLARGET